MAEEKKRYSDEELEEFRTLIEGKLVVAKRDYEQTKSILTNQDANDTDYLSPTYKILEEGSAAQTKEELMNTAERQKKFIQSLEAALVRINNKTYGVSRISGKLIPKERLRAVPHATTCIEDKLNR